MPMLDAVRAAAAPWGLNLAAAVPVERYDAIVAPQYRASAIGPRARSIIVLGNGGGAFWEAFKRHAERNPGWRDRDHPLDDFTHEIIERDVARAARSAGAHCITVYPFMDNGATLNFIALATVAGLAGPSILGVAVHPLFGPWIAFRAALLTDVLIDEPGRALKFDPCPACATRDCIAACPAGAVAFPSGWDIPKCLAHRVEVEAGCAPRCHARAACVLGPEHRYPDDALAYHQMRALRAMRPYYEEHIKGKQRKA
ncbi:MAG TPA: hypothetical protein VEC38_08595 [Candidatus Binataceae bacterium]|nr:hypothetical protein [Candidatus Binataceae bacterium]